MRRWAALLAVVVIAVGCRPEGRTAEETVMFLIEAIEDGTDIDPHNKNSRSIMRQIKSSPAVFETRSADKQSWATLTYTVSRVNDCSYTYTRAITSSIGDSTVIYDFDFTDVDSIEPADQHEYMWKFKGLRVECKNCKPGWPKYSVFYQSGAEYKRVVRALEYFQANYCPRKVKPF